MATADAIFEVHLRDKLYRITFVKTPAKAVIYSITAQDFVTLWIHRATAANGEKFWTSIPEGRQKEAELFGPLIAKALHQEEIPTLNFPSPDQYPDKPDEINLGKRCPYCGQPSIYTDSAEVYGSSYGMIYLCRPCHAWVGVHEGSDMALGRLATKEHRALKRQAHELFDPIAHALGKNHAYHWLARKMGIDKEVCHFGYFDERQCQQAIEICKPVAEGYLQSP